MAIATVTSKGQVTIPLEVRRKLRLHAGTKVDFAENLAGEIVLRPKTGDIRKLYGFLKYDGPSVSIEEMDEAVAKAVAADFKRSVS